MKIIQKISFALVLAVLLQNTCFAAYSPEKNVILNESVHTVSPGLSYTVSTNVCDGARQQIFAFDYTPGQGTEVVPSFGGSVYGFHTVGSMINGFEGDGRIVGGMNTDFFITTTGVPLSCLVLNGELVSSCDSRAALGFLEDGTAIIGAPGIKAELLGRERTLPIAHINKMPAVWGMYLLTDKFYSDTRTSIDTIEIVLRPYAPDAEEAESIRDFLENGMKEAEENESGEEDTQEEPLPMEEASLSEATENDVNVIEIGESAEFAELGEPTENADASGSPAEEPIPDGVSEGETIAEEPETEQADPAAEPEPEIPEEPFDFSAIEFTEDAIKTDCLLPVIVTEIRDVKKGKLKKGEFVLCVPKESCEYLITDVKEGDKFILNCTCNEEFRDCVNVLGSGEILIENGTARTLPNDTLYTGRNPRTAAGIRADGSVVFVGVDGRKTGYSVGFNAKELTDYLLNLGCVSAVNFDGGGSTTVYAADLGEEKSSLKNRPSDNAERGVASGVLFLNTAEPAGDVEYAAVYPSAYTVFNRGTSLKLGDTVRFADGALYPQEASEYGYSVSVLPSFGVTEDGIFTPNGKTGSADIIVSVKGKDEEEGYSYERDFVAGQVTVVDTVTKFSIATRNKSLEPFESAFLTMNAEYNTLPLSVGFDSADWIIEYLAPKEAPFSEEVPAEAEAGNEVAEATAEPEYEYVIADPSFAYFDAEMNFVPVKYGEKYRITASLGGKVSELYIATEKYPFDDAEEHWCAKTAFDSYKKGLFKGEHYGDHRYFFPDRTMMRVEFCTVLARALELPLGEPIPVPEVPIVYEVMENSDNADTQSMDISFLPDESFPETEDGLVIGELYTGEEIEEPVYYADDVADWAKPYVLALYNRGYIDTLLCESIGGDLTLDGLADITRNDVIRILGSFLEVTENDHTSEFPDFVPETEEDIGYFNSVIEAGLLHGYEDGTVRQYDTLTRAQAATIFYRFFEMQK